MKAPFNRGHKIYVTKTMGIGLSAVLLSSVIVQLRPVRQTKFVDRLDPLPVLLPQTVSGWQAEDRPVAQTPELQKVVDYRLNYNEAISRVYSRGETEVSLYVAYWQPGKTHPRLIQQHRPDVCWVGNGWTMNQSSGVIVLKGNEKTRTRPGQYRIFTATDKTRYVVYWHLADGRLSDYSQGEGSPSEEFVATWWRDINQGAPEQYFIRIASNRALEQLNRSDLLGLLLSALGPLGLVDN